MMDDRERLREPRPAARPSQINKERRMDILKGKVAVVTGSTSGIGLAYARAFAGAGANIVLNGIGALADVEKTRIAIENGFGVKAIYSPANMGEPMEIANMISFADQQQSFDYFDAEIVHELRWR
jgi:NAD(P)-dependent dehydrogenase (short-subunit alcohol dehydrogenase family)